MNRNSKFQEKAIKNFYDNRSDLALQRLQELVGDLYLNTGKKRQQTWKYIVTHLESLKVPATQIEHLQKQDNPEILANYVKTLLTKESK